MLRELDPAAPSAKLDEERQQITTFKLQNVPMNPQVTALSVSIQSVVFDGTDGIWHGYSYHLFVDQEETHISTAKQDRPP